MALAVKDVEVSARDRTSRASTMERIFDITGDASYPTNGYPLAASQFGMTTILFLLAEAAVDGAKPIYNHTTGNLMWFFSGGTGARMAEVGNGVSLAASTARVLVIGR